MMPFNVLSFIALAFITAQTCAFGEREDEDIAMMENDPIARSIGIEFTAMMSQSLSNFPTATSRAGDVAKHIRLKIKSLEQDETGVKNSPKRNCDDFKSDGCTIDNKWVKKIAPYQGTFKPACVNHDWCYVRGRASRLTCDKRFYSEMKNACSPRYPSRWIKGIQRKWCKVIAWIYYKVVRKDKYGGKHWRILRKLYGRC